MTHFQNSCKRLENAIKALTSYTLKNQKKTSSYILDIFSNFFFATEDKCCLKVIDEIKTHRSLIQRLQKGNEEQKKFAIKTLEAIENFNNVLFSLNNKKRWRLRKSKIDKPIELSLPITTCQFSFERVKFHQEHVLTKEETDIFRMKGITLLSRFYPSIATTQESIRNATLNAHIDEVSKKLSVSTIISPLPGENCIVSGAFHITPNKKRSAPKKFELTFEATQTAFPDPLQYLGCFSDEMIPPCPLRIEKMPTFSKILAKKGKIARNLLPNGIFNLKAKSLIQHKQKLYEEHSDILLPLHMKLLTTLTKETFPIKDHNDLVALYRAFISECIKKPMDLFICTWLENRKLNYDLFIFKSQNFKDISLLKLGRALYLPCKGIILQHLSENMAFKPPRLSKFEEKLQTLLYRQLLTFFSELEMENFLNLEWVAKQLLFDISLMTNKSEPSDFLTQESKRITQELKNYYSILE